MPEDPPASSQNEAVETTASPVAGRPGNQAVPGMAATVRLLGFDVAVTDYAGACEQIFSWARGSGRSGKDPAEPREEQGGGPAGRTTRLVEAANTHVLAMARHDASFGAAMRCFDLLLPDGMPLIWAVNRRVDRSQRLADRVYGPTLMLRCFDASQNETGIQHFLLGGSPEQLEKLEATLRQRFPEAVICGTYSPPFGEWDDDEIAAMFARVRESGANIVWVGLGCPKQEHWMAQHRDALPPAVYLGVGAAFAFHSGGVRQAPTWMQKRGLEWLFRLCTEPRRLWKRYFKYNALYLFYLASDR